MLRVNQLKMPLDHSENDLKNCLITLLKINEDHLLSFKLIKRSIDARKQDNIFIIYSFDVDVRDQFSVLRRLKNNNNIKIAPVLAYKYKAKADESLYSNKVLRPVVIGAGPCGYFAALLLAQMGYKPLLLERGQSVRERSKKTYGFWSSRTSLDIESNVQFGEGGAGTFSDGKLYSQISDPDNYGRKVLEELVASGASEEILVNNRPHIGTFKLAAVVRRFRARIQELGGEIKFEKKMVDLILTKSSRSDIAIKEYKLEGLKLSDGTVISTNYLVLAVGHSARDTFRMLQHSGVLIKPKPFAVGFRIEHPQMNIDQDRWGKLSGNPQLGHAEYKLIHHATNGHDVYSFCMCPGGKVVGATSGKGQVVTNGMSQHSRNERNANSAIVVNLDLEDFSRFGRWDGDPIAGVFFQEALEKKAFEMGGANYFAPVQRLQDFMSAKVSIAFGSVIPSYLPGVTFADLNLSLPQVLIDAIREAIPIFSSKFPFFNEPDAILTAVETRTSSPLRIPRDNSFESLNVEGLYPAGEGAGYAGGILSAGIDGIKVAEAIALCINKDLSSRSIN